MAVEFHWYSLEDALRADGTDLPALIDVGRTSGAERIVCSPVGLGMDDVVTAAWVHRKARQRGLGTPLVLRQEALWS